jgi:hypothetical protein
MLDIAIVVVALLALVAAVLLAVGLLKPSGVGRVIPGAARPTTRRTAGFVFGAVLAALIVALGVLLALPNYEVTLPDGDRVVAGESTGVRLGFSNSGLAAGSYSAAYSLDGILQTQVVVNVPGRQTAELAVPLPSDLAPGPHTVVVGSDSFQIVALKPAAFSVTTFDTDVKIAKTGQRVNVTAAVMNTGEVAGEFDGELLVNGRKYDMQPIAVDPGTEEALSYTFRGRAQGKNRLRLGDARSTLVVVKPIHYPNGHYLRRVASGGHGVLSVKNGNRVDGVVVLTRTSARKVPVIACYVRARQSFTIEGIPDGSYWMYYALGRDWNSYTDGFLTSTERGYFRSPAKFTTSTWTTSWTDSMYRYTQGHVRYSGWRITLNPVAGGTARTTSVGQNDFPRVH